MRANASEGHASVTLEFVAGLDPKEALADVRDKVTLAKAKLPDETESTIKHGWLHTGDFGRMDEEGYLYIIDRKHDMIISGGKNIYPREIEEILYKHEAVLEAAVVAHRDADDLEKPKAFVVLKPGADKAAVDGLADLVKDKIGKWKYPRWVEIVDDLPKTATGKIQRFKLRGDG